MGRTIKVGRITHLLAVMAVSGMLLGTTGTAVGRPAVLASSSLTVAAADQGAYIMQQLQDFSQRYLARVSGRDTNLPPRINGHDEFAAQWTREMLANLHGLPVGVFRQAFPTPGFAHLPAGRPGKNIVVTVPGAQHPDRAIVVGAHYDGEPTSQGSAYDDASGCMIVLGLARAMGRMWRMHGLPALTVEFVLFDAEEQGLIGSTAFAFAYRRGALLPRPVLMLDEEQSGVGYPIRPFGLLSRPPVPSFALTTPPTAQLVRFLHLDPVLPIPRTSQAVLANRLTVARRAAFAALHAVYPALSYQGGPRAAFIPSDEQYLLLGNIPQPGASDNAPFQALGVPTLVLAGDAGYYDDHHRDWSYPFDQPQDTFRALACDTGGAAQPTAALAAALALPAEVSLSLLQAYAPPYPGRGLIAVSPAVAAGSPARFQATGGPHVRWDFGDGSSAAGSVVRHTYRQPGAYQLTVRAGPLHQTFSLIVQAHPTVFHTPFRIRPPPIIPWRPPELQGIPGCL